MLSKGEEQGDFGIRRSNRCIKRGNVWLTAKDGKRYRARTTCKTWACLGCADRRRQAFVDMVAYGVQILKPCWFITVTYRKKEDVEPVDAQYARRTLRRFLDKCRKVYGPAMAWVIVPELTKKNQAHFHMVMSGIQEKSIKKIHAKMSAMWLESTGDSYIVWTTPVWSAAGAGGYLAKYMNKQMASRKRFKELGFDRRFSRSRNWPKIPVGMVGTNQDEWSEVSFTYGKKIEELDGPARESSPLLEWAGDEHTEFIKVDRKKRRLKGLAKRSQIPMIGV